jgi:hypothetical protein
MKTTCLFFLTISWAALMHGRGYAVPSSPASRQTAPESSANTASEHPRDPARRNAAPADDRRHQTGENASDEQRDPRRASDKNQRPSRVSLTGLTKTNRPNQLSNSGRHSLPGNALHQPGSDKSSTADKGGLIQNEMVHNSSSIRTSSVVRPTVASLNNVRPGARSWLWSAGRHRGPNPAVVGGSANSDSRNTGAMNGTRMNRKP